jgi:TonB family protein
MAPSPDVFTVAEIARAAGVARQVIEQLAASGRLRPIRGSRLFAASDAIRVGREARAEVLRTPSAGAPPSALEQLPLATRLGNSKDRQTSTLGSFAVHATCLAIVVVASTAGTAEVARTVADSPTRLVFWAGPGPGGGGGGGGRAPKLERPRVTRPNPARSETAVEEPELLPARAVTYPVAYTAGDARAASTEDAGQGAGVGTGVGEGFGGGQGGGPFRPGSGIDPPRLLREVKAQYSEEARRRGISGSVVLEIVIRNNGTVGDVTVLRGLGYGLDERASAAVRAWQFAPARRLGQPVDVIVEVEVDFSLR